MVDESCVGCVYYWVSYGCAEYQACDYIMRTGKRRPCPSGKECTVRKQINTRRRYKWVGRKKP